VFRQGIGYPNKDDASYEISIGLEDRIQTRRLSNRFGMGGPRNRTSVAVIWTTADRSSGRGSGGPRFRVPLGHMQFRQKTHTYVRGSKLWTCLDYWSARKKKRMSFQNIRTYFRNLRKPVRGEKGKWGKGKIRGRPSAVKQAGVLPTPEKGRRGGEILASEATYLIS